MYCHTQGCAAFHLHDKEGMTIALHISKLDPQRYSRMQQKIP